MLMAVALGPLGLLVPEAGVLSLVDVMEVDLNGSKIVANIKRLLYSR